MLPPRAAWLPYRTGPIGFYRYGEGPIFIKTTRTADRAPKARPCCPAPPARCTPFALALWAPSGRPMRAYGAPSLPAARARCAAATAAAARTAEWGSMPHSAALLDTYPAGCKSTSKPRQIARKSLSRVGTAALNLPRYSPEHRSRTITMSPFRSAPANICQMLKSGTGHV